MEVAALIPVVYLAVVTPSLIRIDVAEHRLPNRMVVPGIAVGLGSAMLQGSLLGLVAAVAYAGVLFLLSLGGGVGMGDVKLAAAIGLACPTVDAALAAPGAAFLLGGVVASIALMRRGPRARIAFGPPMLLGYWLALVGSMVAVFTGSGTTAGAP